MEGIKEGRKEEESVCKMRRGGEKRHKGTTASEAKTDWSQRRKWDGMPGCPIMPVSFSSDCPAQLCWMIDHNPVEKHSETRCARAQGHQLIGKREEWAGAVAHHRPQRRQDSTSCNWRPRCVPLSRQVGLVGDRDLAGEFGLRLLQTNYNAATL